MKRLSSRCPAGSTRRSPPRSSSREGHDVIGLSMQLYDQTQGDVRFGSCCTLDDLYDARRVARSIGIPHYIVNFERRFEEHVVADFVREYAAGRTPIPCVHCNGDLKFASLVERAEGFDATAVATGHYARVERDPESGAFRLLRGVDRAKDQSYFLFTLSQAQLARARSLSETSTSPPSERKRVSWDWPLRRSRTARRFASWPPESTRNSSHAVRTPLHNGLIRDRDGRVLGEHAGVHRFTIGQRKGLGLSSPFLSTSLISTPRRPTSRSARARRWSARP